MKTIQRQSPMRTRCFLLLWPISLLTGGRRATASDRLCETEGIKWELPLSASSPHQPAPLLLLQKTARGLSRFPCPLFSAMPHAGKGKPTPFSIPSHPLSQATAERAGGSFTGALTETLPSDTAPKSGCDSRTADAREDWRRSSLC